MYIPYTRVSQSPCTSLLDSQEAVFEEKKNEQRKKIVSCLVQIIRFTFKIHIVTRTTTCSTHLSHSCFHNIQIIVG